MDLINNIEPDDSLDKQPGSLIERNLILKDIEDSHLAGYDDVRTVNIAKAIENHDSIEVQILKLMDSDFSHLNNKDEMSDIIDDVIDFKKLKKIIYIFSGKDFSSQNSYPEWEHSYACSVLMKTMIEENELPVSNTLPMAALLHDIGKVFLKRHRPQKYKMAESYSFGKRIPLYVAENCFLKITHAEISGLLMRKWEMPEEIAAPVYAHHNKEIPEKYILETALLKFADWVDSSSRREFCTEPELHIMSAAGIESIDNDYWIRRHREIICDVHNQYFSDSNTRRLKRAIKREADGPLSKNSRPNRENTLSANTILK